MHCFKLMSKMAIMAVMFLVITAASAFCTPLNTYWDMSAVPTGDNVADSDNALTSLFYQITYVANSNTTQYDTNGDDILSVGDYYLNDGNAIATNLRPITGNDTEGMNSVYEFTFVLRDLLGVVQDIATGTDFDYVTNKYVSGTIDMYVDVNRNSTFGPEVQGTLDLDDDAGFDDGKLVGTIGNVTGIGASTFTKGSTAGIDPEFITGSYELSGAFTFLLDDFWYDEHGNDLKEKLVDYLWLIGFTGGNIANINQDFSGTSAYDHPNSYGNYSNKVLYTISGDHDTSFELAAVPEPATCLLLGCGLLSLSGISRKKFKK